MVNASQITDTENFKTGVHRLHEQLCSNVISGNNANSLFALNHYTGSWDTYNYCNDPQRRNLTQRRRERYDRPILSRKQNTQTEISSWINAFVKEIGKEHVNSLLQYAGYDS